MRKLPHFMDHGMHKKGHGPIGKTEADKNYDENYKKIKMRPTKGTVVVEKLGYTKISYEV